MTATTTRTPAVSADIFGTTLTLNFPLTKGTPELSLDLTKLDADIIRQATLHGLKQKLCDAAAIARNTTTGQSATALDKYNAVKSVYDRITGPNPTWNAVREGVERAPNSIFIRAVAEATGKDYATTAANLKNMTKDNQAMLKKNVRIVEIMHRMELETVGTAAAGDDLLEMLSGATPTPTLEAVEPATTPTEGTTKRRQRKSDAPTPTPDETGALPPSNAPMGY